MGIVRKTRSKSVESALVESARPQESLWKKNVEATRELARQIQAEERELAATRNSVEPEITERNKHGVRTQKPHSLLSTMEVDKKISPPVPNTQLSRSLHDSSWKPRSNYLLNASEILSVTNAAYVSGKKAAVVRVVPPEHRNIGDEAKRRLEIEREVTREMEASKERLVL